MAMDVVVQLLQEHSQGYVRELCTVVLCALHVISFMAVLSLIPISDIQNRMLLSLLIHKTTASASDLWGAILYRMNT